MVNPPRQKGTAAETAVVRYLREEGFPAAERRALHGNTDLGDVVNVPDVVLEIKNASKMKIAEWLKEAALEASNADASVFFVVAKPNGVGLTSVSSWYAITTVHVMTDLLRIKTEAERGGPNGD